MKKVIIPDYSDIINCDLDSFYRRLENAFDSPAEAKIYRLLYKLVQLDSSYKVRYGFYFHPNDSFVYPGGQVDFLIYKENVGVAILEVKGGKYLKDDKYIKAQQQVKKANYILNTKIKVYNIIFFPDDIVPKDEKFDTDDNGMFILDNNDYIKFIECNNSIVNYFDSFFNHDRYKKPIDGTSQFANRLFDLDMYSLEQEKERVAKEAVLIDYKVKSIDLVSDSGYNCFYLTGYSGTGKTFIAMNMAVIIDKDVLFVVRNEELFKSIYNFFIEKTSAIVNDYVWGKNGEKYRKHSYTEFLKVSGKKICLFLLDINTNSIHYKKDFCPNGDLFKIINDCDLIFIDEVQDASFSEIETLLSLIFGNNEKTLYLMGDSRQFTNIKKIEEFNKIRSLLSKYALNKKLLLLNLKYSNCRNSLEIKNFIYKLVNETYVYDESIKSIIGIKVLFLLVPYKLNDTLLNLLISIKDVKDGRIIFISDISNDRYSKFITKKYGINKFEHKISYNLSKGNEYSKVVVMGAEIKHLVDDNEIDRNILSLAAGRAKQDLSIVFYINNDEEKMSIIKKLKETYLFNEMCFVN